jgi:regulator of replication initiation timing
MRINAQMYEGTIRVLGAQNQDMRQENAELRSENILLRREVDEARSNKMDREFQIAMAAEKNQRTNAGFQKLLQIGSVVAAKIGGADENQGGGASALGMLISEFGSSLRADQIGVLMNALDMGQKIMFMEIMRMVQPAEPKPGPSAGLPSGANGAPSP